MTVDFAVAFACVAFDNLSFATHAVRFADGKVDCAAAVQRTRENLRVTCAILREARQACAGEINYAVHRNGRKLQTVQVVIRDSGNHRVVAVGLPGNCEFSEILNRG